MTIKPMGDRVLVKMEQIQEKTAGGIFIPQTAPGEDTDCSRTRDWR